MEAATNFTPILWRISEWNSYWTTTTTKNVQGKTWFHPLVADWIVKTEHYLPKLMSSEHITRKTSYDILIKDYEVRAILYIENAQKNCSQ